jgi:hypothetical protein
MSTLKHAAFDTLSTTGSKAKTLYLAREFTGVVSGAALRYSSPWPWVLALVISSTMWVGIGWLIWTLV